MAPQICNLVCFRHKDMDFPPWADSALILTDKGVVGREWVEDHGGQVVLVPLVAGRSTTNVVKKILEAGE